MFPASKEALDLLNKNYRQTVEITFDGLDQSLTLTEKNIMLGGLSVDRYSVSGSRIEIGSAVAAELSLELNNRNGEFDDIKFEGAELFVRVGVTKYDADRWENATTQYVPLGYFTVDEPPRKLSSISLSALDRMVLFDKQVDWTKFTFPITVSNMLAQTCLICNVPLRTDIRNRPNHDYVVNEAPSDETTYRQIIQWIAELTATCAFIDWEGKLRLSWYAPCGIKIRPSERYSSDMLENDIAISGVQIIDAESNTYLAGEDSYAIRIDGNSLIQHHFQEVAGAIREVIEGFTYRPYECTTKPMPYLFPMDKIEYVDKKGKSHDTIVTNVTFTLNGETRIEGKGETETKTGYATANPLTNRERMVLAKVKSQMDAELTNKEKSLLQFNSAICATIGMYQHDVNDNGGIIRYYSDRPSLDDSTIIYTYHAGGFAWTDDWNKGNPVWVYGVDKNGNAILNTICANAIITNLINSSTGELMIKGDRLSIESSNFKLDRNGIVTVKEGEFTGIIRAIGEANFVEIDSGSITFWKIDENNAIDKLLASLYSSNTNVILRIDPDCKHFSITDLSNTKCLSFNYGDNPYGEQFLTCLGDMAVKGALSLGGTTPIELSIKNISLGGEVKPALHVPSALYVVQDVVVDGSLVVGGDKHRKVVTENYGNRLLSAYETSTPYFGDIGKTMLDQNGTAFVPIEPIFGETVERDSAIIFCQPCSAQPVTITHTKDGFQLNNGAPNDVVYWEIKAKQKGLANKRLEQTEG